MSKTEHVKALDQEYILQTYGRYPIALVRGQGARAWDAEGKEYLDFLGGIAVNVLGHCHPAVVGAIQEQAATLIHCSNLYYTGPGTELAAALVQAGGLDRVFLCNSGAEANEGAFKLARKYHWRRGRPQQNRIVAATHSFHGRTLATLTATGKPEIQEGFAPLPPGFTHVEWGEAAALDAAVDETVAAVVLEPVQGEGGIHPADPAYLAAARAAADRVGALLILDEIQCGLGRTGHFFAYQGYGVRPDIITLAKGLGGGLPIGAICATAEAATGFTYGDHGSTFGANPVACAAALAVLGAIAGEGLAANAARVGAYLTDRLTALQQKYPAAIRSVRGAGLMVGVELGCDAKAVLAECHRSGLLANVTSGNVVRFLPPLNITTTDVDEAVGKLHEALASVLAAAASS